MPDAKTVVENRDKWGWRVSLYGPKGMIQLSAFLTEEGARGYASTCSERTGIPWEVEGD